MKPWACLQGNKSCSMRKPSSRISTAGLLQQGQWCSHSPRPQAETWEKDVEETNLLSGPSHCPFASPVPCALPQTQETLPPRLFPLLSLEIQIVLWFPSHLLPILIREAGLSESSPFPRCLGSLCVWVLRGFISWQPIRKCEPRDVLQNSVIVPGGTWLKNMVLSIIIHFVSCCRLSNKPLGPFLWGKKKILSLSD